MNTITITAEENILEISQEGINGTLNVDVLTIDFDLEYSFEIEIDEMADMIMSFQKERNII